MNLEEFERASETDLRKKVNECFEAAKTDGGQDKPYRYLEAQFYISELDRRKHERERQADEDHAARDFKYETIIVWMIAGEILLAIVSLIYTVYEGRAQNAILSNLEAGTKATADLLQKQLAEEYRVFINPQPTGTGILLYNNSKSEISLWGLRLGENRPVSTPGGSAIIPGDHSGELIPFGNYYPNLRLTGVVPFDLYLKDATGKEFIWSGRIHYDKGTGSGSGLEAPDGALRAEQWSDTIRFSEAPSKAK